MPHFGPFHSRMEALLAACPLILTQPHATAGRRDDPNFGVRWRASTEYCAWLYYTPDSTYDMSLLVESTEAIPPDNQGERSCRAPAFVNDPRYPKHSLKYLYFLHNHPAVPTHISERDIRAVIKTAMIHGKFVETAEGRIPVGVIAFIANTYEPSSHSCDGFYEYHWGSTEVGLKVLHESRKTTPWACGDTHQLRTPRQAFILDRERQLDCVPAVLCALRSQDWKREHTV